MFNVKIDGIDVGTLGPKQSKIFELPPGQHVLRLLSWPGRGSGDRPLIVGPGEMKEFYCFTNAFGLVSIRPPRAKDLARLKRLGVVPAEGAP